MSTALLEANDISKAYAGAPALRGVSFELRAGEVHALVGENGAGKSTLIKVITGAVLADSGTIALDGRIIERNSPTVSRGLGIAAIYQQPALFPDLTVAENVALADERRGLWRLVKWPDRRQKCRALLDRVGARIDPDTCVRSLGMPQQQLVEIARALGTQARVLIFDEPTASLSSREVVNLFRVIRELKQAGVAVVYVSHRLEELFEIADRVTILRDGGRIETCAMAEVDRPALIRLMVGREVASVFPKRAVPVGDTVLDVKRLNSRASGLTDIALHVRAGEIVGLSGLVGAGRTELAETLFGLRPVDSGEIVLHGRPERIDSPAQATRLGIAYVPEDRRRHGLVMQMPLTANTTLACLSSISRRGLFDFAREREMARDYKERLGTKAESILSPVETLSGGNQQKVLIGRWLATKPVVLILDEPTQGVDVGAKSEIHKLMVDLAEQGLAILMISSELPEVLGMSDRIVVMHAGAITGVLDRKDATEERVLSLALGSAA